MLLTDGIPNHDEDLRVYESGILDVANNESIDLVTKLRLALGEISEDVLDVLISRSNDITAMTRRAKGVSDVVVTRQMKRWHALHTLEVVYRDTFNNQLNDRYQQKFEEYRDLAKQARLYTLRFGIGIVSNPVPAAQPPVLTLAPVLGLQASTYFVCLTWVSNLGQEGAPGKILTIDTADGQGPVVGAQNVPVGIVGFNVYMGLSADALALQNSAPIAVNGSFALVGALSSGPAPGTGQSPDYYITGGSGLTRG